MNEIQTRLGELQARGWTIPAIADEVGVTVNAVEKWKAGQRQPSNMKAVFMVLDGLAQTKTRSREETNSTTERYWTESVMMSSTFVGAKNLFDQEYGTTLVLPHSLVPVDGKHLANVSLKNTAGERSEEYFKWQFIYALIHSGLYSKDYLGAEVQFPKGNKKSAPIKIDACIFDDKQWIDYYTRWRESKDDDAVAGCGKRGSL